MRSNPLVLVLVVFVVSLAAATVAVGGIAAAETPAELTLSGPDTAESGETVTVSVEIAADVSIYGVQYQLTSSTPITGSVEKGGFLEGNGSSVVIVNTVDNSTVDYGETRTGPTGVSGEGTLSTLELTVPASTSTDRLTLSFARAAVSDPSANPVETTTRNLTIELDQVSDSGTASPSGEDDDNSESGGPASGGAGGGAQATTTAAADVTAQSSAWPPTVPDDVRSRFADNDRVPVIILLSSEGDADSLAAALTSQGAVSVRQHDASNSVSATVTANSLRSVADQSTVRAVRYDSSASTVSATDAPETPAPTAASEASDQQRSPTTVSQPSTTTQTVTTSTTFPVFGPVAPLLGVFALAVLFIRGRVG